MYTNICLAASKLDTTASAETAVPFASLAASSTLVAIPKASPVTVPARASPANILPMPASPNIASEPFTKFLANMLNALVPRPTSPTASAAFRPATNFVPQPSLPTTAPGTYILNTKPIISLPCETMFCILVNLSHSPPS